MLLEKVINRIVIQSEYKDFVDKYLDNILTEFKGKIHSIYMCGSIPKGTAKPFKSDADFTIVCVVRPGKVVHSSGWEPHQDKA